MKQNEFSIQSQFRCLGWIALGLAGVKALLIELALLPSSYSIAKSALGLLLVAFILLAASRPIRSSRSVKWRIGELFVSSTVVLAVLSVL